MNTVVPKLLASPGVRSTPARRRSGLVLAAAAMLVVLLVALPLPASGSAVTTAAAPAPAAIARVPTPSPTVPLGAPATAAAQALAAAQASLDRARSCAAGSVPCSTPSSVRASGFGHLAPIPAASNCRNPPLVTGAAMAYDNAPSDEYVVIFGGLAQNGTVMGQTWIYGGGCWENPYALGDKGIRPGPRWDAVMAYDEAAGYLVLFGGCVTPATNGLCRQSVNDTWKWVSGAWIQIRITSSIHTRWDAAAAYDPAMGDILVYGGASGLADTPPAPGTCTNPVPTLLSDTWGFTVASGSPSWVQLSTSGPPAAYGGRMAFDGIDDEMILFGGTSFYRTDDVCTPPTELAQTFTGNETTATWAFSGGSWSAVGLTVGPPERRDASMGSAGGSGPIILEGGTNWTGTVFSDIWELVNVARGWAIVTANLQAGVAENTSPLPRYDAGFAWDLWDGYFLLLGGTSPAGVVLGDGWGYAPLGNWTSETRPLAAMPSGPASRYQESMAWDDALGAVVMFGGETCGASACSFLGDTWLYQAGTWTELSLSVSPSARFGAAMDFNPSNGQILLFGGCGNVCPLGDTWVFAKPNANSAPAWRELFPTVAPPARYYAAMAFDELDQLSVLFGGCEGSRGACPAGDTWIYNTTIARWKFITTPGGVSWPSPRFGAAIASLTRAAQPASGSFAGVLMFGGQGTWGMLGDTWNFSHGLWSLIAPEVAPTPRIFGTLVYDPIDTSLILLGGCEATVCPTLDPWTFSLQSPPPTNSGGGGGGGGGTGPPPPPPPPPPPWPWNYTNLTLIVQNSPGGPVPQPFRYGAAAVWDPVDGPSGFALILGGRTLSGATIPIDDELAGYLWSNLANYG
jgi:hypothetical protein